jgi:hypothetical protein
LTNEEKTDNCNIDSFKQNLSKQEKEVAEIQKHLYTFQSERFDSFHN